MADLLLNVLDDDKYVIVPLPTIRRHIRERGFDHIGRMASIISRNSSSSVSKILWRNNDAVQVGASREERKKQAKTAYKVRGDIDTNANYLLLDDV